MLYPAIGGTVLLLACLCLAIWALAKDEARRNS